jgi:hypothetical protein
MIPRGRLTTRRPATALVSAILLALSAWTASSARAAVPSRTGITAVAQRGFTITGSLGEAFTTRTVTGQLTTAGVPNHVVVTETGTGRVLSNRIGKATLVGASLLHSGYVQWDITARAHGDLYALHLPPVLPGGGGFFDADLQIDFAGGVNGSWQIPMFDGTITGGPGYLAHLAGIRTLSISGSLGEPFTAYTITATVSRNTIPTHVVVTATSTATVVSTRTTTATLIGASWLHTGFLQWDVTGGRVANGDLYYLHLPAVLPAAGGFFDADLEVAFAGGANGGLQIPMFDGTVH